MRIIVRNFTETDTHIADVSQTHAALYRGQTYRRPPGLTKALCGHRIDDGIAVPDGTPVKCDVCSMMAPHIAQGGSGDA